MTEYIFYTPEGVTQTPNGEDIQNCQILGSAFGKNKHQALKNLLIDSPWIKDMGFDPYKAIGKELTTTSNAEAKLAFLTNILDKRQLEEYKNWLNMIGM